jgi:hypothetical protein
MKFLRRIGPDPHANGQSTPALENCPDIWELEDGDFAIIGIDMTDAAKALRVPRRILVDAKSAIPAKA